MTDPEFALLRNWWQERFKDMMAPTPEQLPPFREVNHRINLIDLKKRYVERCATCPQALKPQL
jgi:hypothetical protein